MAALVLLLPIVLIVTLTLGLLLVAVAWIFEIRVRKLQNTYASTFSSPRANPVDAVRF